MCRVPARLVRRSAALPVRATSSAAGGVSSPSATRRAPAAAEDNGHAEPKRVISLEALRARVRKVMAPVACSGRVQNELREFWQSRLDLERVENDPNFVLPPHLRGWRCTLRGLMLRPRPLRLTGYYVCYSTGVSSVAFYSHYHRGSLGCSSLDYCVQTVIDHLVTHSNLFQGVTGFLASALFLMVSFRVHRASSRWWEGSTHWGHLMSTIRSLCLTSQLSMTNKHVATEVSMLAYAHARCLEWHLRHEGEEKLIDLFSRILSERQLQDMLRSPQKPLWVLQQLTLRIADAYDHKEVKNVRLLVSLMVEVQSMVRITQEVQRINSTREPWSYQKHMRLTTQIWLAVLPFALLPPLQFMTPLFSACVGYVVYRLDDVSVELCNPFGLDRSDLPICLINERLRSEVETMIMAYLTSTSRQRQEELFEALGCEGMPDGIPAVA